METKEREVIFAVYGTLKSNHGNHRCLGDEAEFLGTFITEPIYTLLDGGFPVVERGGDTAIHGELWKVRNERDIANVFGLEGCESQIQGHEDNWYDFETVKTEFGDANIFVQDQGQSNHGPKITSGIWR